MRQLQAQVERAARVQRSLLPDVSLPVGEFRLATLYRPCECLGGDFYDLAWRRECALLLVADVMGHGFEAALLTMIVKAAFQEAAAINSDPAEVLAGMHSRLHNMLRERAFVAAAVARLDLQGPGIQLVNAGLPHPFLLHASDRTVEQLRLDGCPLGLFDGRTPPPSDACTLQLAPRDVLIVASDGIGSIECEPGHLFEDHRLGEVLAGLAGKDGGQIIERLMAEAVDFGRGRPLPDDINVVTVSRVPTAISDVHDALPTEREQPQIRSASAEAGATTEPSLHIS
jgi:serine phosphatase RsbU (regulator of sigma subunit)